MNLILWIAAGVLAAAFLAAGSSIGEQVADLAVDGREPAVVQLHRHPGEEAALVRVHLRG